MGWKARQREFISQRKNNYRWRCRRHNYVPRLLYTTNYYSFVVKHDEGGFIFYILFSNENNADANFAWYCSVVNKRRNFVVCTRLCHLVPIVDWKSSHLLFVFSDYLLRYMFVCPTLQNYYMLSLLVYVYCFI